MMETLLLMMDVVQLVQYNQDLLVLDFLQDV
jgi:hypothetical protein